MAFPISNVSVVPSFCPLVAHFSVRRFISLSVRRRSLFSVHRSFFFSNRLSFSLLFCQSFSLSVRWSLFLSVRWSFSLAVVGRSLFSSFFFFSKKISIVVVRDVCPSVVCGKISFRGNFIDYLISRLISKSA